MMNYRIVQFLVRIALLHYFIGLNPNDGVVDVKFDVVDAKFDVVDAKFDVVDAKFDVIDAKFDVIDAIVGVFC
jgi:hypothetical protein